MKKLVQFILDRRWIQHLAFWLLSYGILLFHFRVNTPPGAIDYLYTGLYHLALLFGVYANLRFALPKLLEQGRYIWYLLALIGIMGLMIVIHEFTINYLSTWLFPGYYLISFIDYWGLFPYFAIYLVISTLLRLSKSWFSLLESERLLAQIQKEKFQAELQALKGQIHPHFLFNSLNNLYALSLKKSQELPDMILKLSDLLRYMIYDANEDYIALKDELNHLQSYIALQKLRLNTHQTVDLKISGEIRDQQVVPLIFINFIENAFKHGVRSQDRPTLVGIQFDVREDQLTMEVLNTKQELQASMDSRLEKGIGLDNVQRRLALRYPQKHRLQFEEDEESFKVKLELDL